MSAAGKGDVSSNRADAPGLRLACTCGSPGNRLHRSTVRCVSARPSWCADAGSRDREGHRTMGLIASERA